jgi:DNA-directed RNA polymerase specialized sigma subunit
LLDALVTQSSEEALLDKEALKIACDAVMDREWLAMRLRARGFTFKQIAGELGVGTVRARQIYLNGLRRARKGLNVPREQFYQ